MNDFIKGIQDGSQCINTLENSTCVSDIEIGLIHLTIELVYTCEIDETEEIDESQLKWEKGFRLGCDMTAVLVKSEPNRPILSLIQLP